MYMRNMQLSGMDELSVPPELGVVARSMKIHKPLTSRYYMNSLQAIEKW